MGRGSGKIYPSYIIVSQKLLEDVVMIFVSYIQVCLCGVTCVMDLYVMFHGSMFDITFEQRTMN